MDVSTSKCGMEQSVNCKLHLRGNFKVSAIPLGYGMEQSVNCKFHLGGNFKVSFIPLENEMEQSVNWRSFSV